MGTDRDGTIIIEISGDEMTAVAFVMPSEGNGKPVTVPDVKKALEKNGVVFLRVLVLLLWDLLVL